MHDGDDDQDDDNAIESELYMKRMWPPIESSGRRRSSGSRRLFSDESGANEKSRMIAAALNDLDHAADVVFIAHDDDKCFPLLYLASRQSSELFALRLSNSVLDAFKMEARDAQPVLATGSGQSSIVGRTVYDTLLLNMDYELELFRGKCKLCKIDLPSRFRALNPSLRPKPVSSTISLEPVFLDAVSHRDDDVEMETTINGQREEDEEIGNLVGLRDAVDDRVTLDTSSGKHLRIRLPWCPSLRSCAAAFRRFMPLCQSVLLFVFT